ncbi:MAG: DNA-binding response regulator, AraC family [uncultured Cytophagales bacterium]|uniref:DNA-binding response regulator, AraC family n=1 Tax=uncultured Cytophagales bacterium TaxID=158755 RepID=A0A6J4KVD2_9SPHI|nr:MAG: DNA-binding response regulator, AraC family [uncultured Cytophagales bacterium]
MIATPLLALPDVLPEQTFVLPSGWAGLASGLVAAVALLLFRHGASRLTRHRNALAPERRSPSTQPETDAGKPSFPASFFGEFRASLAPLVGLLAGKAAEARRRPEGELVFTGREVDAMHRNAARLLELMGGLPAPAAENQPAVAVPTKPPVPLVVASSDCIATPPAGAALPPLAPEKEGEPPQPAGEAEPLLLIVEDNEEVRRYLCESFAGQYQVLEAGHGLEGLRKAVEAVPDLVISDLMMPGMDGIELCRHLKADERTSHIPVILLTARASVESKLDGLETGADDYVTKPFHPQELRVRVRNLIAGRRNLRARFGREVKLQPKDITISSADEKFLQNAIAVVEKHMADSGFSVEALENEMMLSKMQLYRKLKALTDQSPTEFVRTLRLKRAASLLSQRSGNISEIAYEVGFNNLSYFAKCFKDHYGVPPSEYATRPEALV